MPITWSRSSSKTAGQGNKFSDIRGTLLTAMRMVRVDGPADFLIADSCHRNISALLD